VGHVAEDSGEGVGKGPAKMIVDEILHGLPKGVRELTVETGAGTSCYMRLAKGERYVIYGSPIAGATERISRDWCSFSFDVAGNETLLAALEQAERKGNANLLGKVQVMHQEFDVSGEGAPGVRVTATNGTTALETLTNSTGEFEFPNVSPGKYHVRVESPDFFEDKFRFPDQDPAVEPMGCGYQNLYVWTNGRIDGTVRGIDAKPIAGVTVQAFVTEQRGELGNSALRETQTGADGSYILSGLPPGAVVIAVNGEKYDDKAPWTPTFYPGTGDRERAQRILLDRGEKRSGIDLQLAPPRQPAMLHIEAVLEDGSPAPDSGANVENTAGIQRFFVRPVKNSNVLDVRVYEGETYVVRGFRVVVNAPQEPVEAGKPIRMRSSNWSGSSAPVQVNGPDAHVRVVLHADPPFGK